MKLRRNERCPVHKSYFCCGRETLPKKPKTVRPGIQRIEDLHHPRGYRELRSPAEMRKLLNRKIVEQNRICPICHGEFTDYNDIVPDHIHLFRHVALPAPTERDKTQLYAQRYIKELPAAGEVIIFDRSWYNRALVEHVMGFCTDKQYSEFLRMCPGFEGLLRSNGIILIKYWFEVSEEEQHRRFLRRIEDPMRRWKLSPMDLESHRRWFDYSRARDAMFAATDTPQSPWYVVQADDKKRARLNCISHLLSAVPWKPVPREKVELPKRQKPHGYEAPNWNYRWIPELH